MDSRIAIWALSSATIACMLIRPNRIAEWLWAVCGAAIIVAAGLLPGASAARAVFGGLDVYLFLAGMLALAEVLRVQGVFDWIAALTLPWTRGSAARLFTAVYLAGVVVTTLLSNDGTILLLTPAVLALVKRTRVSPMPLLYGCAFVSNAASFVLPIANPANLVVFPRLPRLGEWISDFGLASLVSVCVTYAALRWFCRGALRERFADGESAPKLTPKARFAGIWVGGSALLLVAAAGVGLQVGLVAAVLGALCLGAMWLVDRAAPAAVLREGPWSIIPLVAGLFVIVEALDRSGVLEAARGFFRHSGTLGAAPGGLLTGAAVALADNVLNNLPVGVLTRYSVQSPQVAPFIAHAALVSVDLGPNFSITGSLATLLWIMMLRRDGIELTPWQFLRAGAIVTIPALALALLLVR
jgi:arsenical pump membrane protein